MLKFKSLLFLAFFSAYGALAQNDKYNKWALGLNSGIIGSINETNNIKPFNSNGLRIHVKYMFKPNFGVMLLGGYNSFLTDADNATRTKQVNIALEAVYTLSSLFKLKNQKMSLLIHAGPGFGTLWNTNFQVANPTDPYFKNQDDLFNLNIGITPQYAIAKNVLLNLDFSYSLNFKQDHSFDYMARKKGTAIMYNLSAGVLFTIAKKKSQIQENL